MRILEQQVKDHFLELRHMLPKFDKHVLIFEKALYNTRIDGILFTDTGVYGVEIKTEHDSLKRLHNQITEYFDYCHYVYILCHDKHLPKIEKELPPHIFDKVGIISYVNIGSKIFSGLYKEPKLNNKIHVRRLSNLLWSTEIFRMRKSLVGGLPKPQAKNREVTTLINAIGKDRMVQNVSKTYYTMDMDVNKPINFYQMKRDKLNE